MRYLICTYSLVFCILEILYFTGYVQHPKICIWLRSIFISWLSAACRVWIGNFYASIQLKVLLTRYLAVFITSSHRSSGILLLTRIALAFVISSLPDCSAAPFCAGVYGADHSTINPFPLAQVVKSDPNDISPSNRMIWTCRLYRRRANATKFRITMRLPVFHAIIYT